MLKIGFSSCFFHADPERAIFKGKTLMYLEQSLVHWVTRAGVLGYMIPAPENDSPLSVSDYAADLDALILQGGSDVSPQSYNETPLRVEWAGDYIRDQYEISLVKAFQYQRKPILGVCRGLQLLNVAAGGTLYQDIETQIPHSKTHRKWEIYDQNFHYIEFEASSRLKKIFPASNSSVKVNSVHHQAVKDLGKNVLVEARAKDDQVIEAISYKSDSYVLGIQWHPEFHDSNDKSLLDSDVILKDFLLEAQTRKG